MEEKEMIEPIGEKKEVMAAWTAIVFYTLLYLMGFILLGGIVSIASLVLGLGMDWMTEKTPVSILVSTSMTLAITFCITYLMHCVIEKRPWSELGLNFKGRAKDLGYGALLAAVIFIIGTAVCLLAGQIEITSVSFPFTNLLYSFLLFIIVALNEELSNRGYILGRLLRTRMAPWIGILISSLIFAGLHLLNPGMGVIPFVNLCIAGLLFGVLYFYTHNLTLPISFHLFWNWFQGPVLGFEVSGQDFFRTILTQHLPADSIWNGGVFGFEGSVLCTLLTTAAIGGIIWYYERKADCTRSLLGK